MMVSLTLPVKTTNPANGSQGWSKDASYAKARRRRGERATARIAVAALVGGSGPFAPALAGVTRLTVTLTRLAPSDGLDPHDGLGAALKGTIDGVADALGLKNDRDARVTWVLAQERAKTYGVRIEISRTCT